MHHNLDAQMLAKFLESRGLQVKKGPIYNADINMTLTER